MGPYRFPERVVVESVGGFSVRLAVVAALAVLATGVPGAASGPPSSRAAVAAPSVPRGTALAPVGDDAAWLRGMREAIAGTGGPAREVLGLLQGDPPGAAAEEEYDRDVRSVFVGDDYDGDGAAEVVVYRSAWDNYPQGPQGFTELTAYSGRSGARRWHRRVDGLVGAQPVLAKVGPTGRRGIVLIATVLTPKPWDLLNPLPLLFPDFERHVRVAGVTSTGRVAYDAALSTTDGKGDIQFGGLFDAFPGGGSELLFGRVSDVLPGVLTTQPVAISGYDGVLHPLREVSFVVANAVAYLAIGDLDRDKRADFLEVREIAADRGTVVAHSVIEERTLWTADGVTVGWTVWVGGTANVTGGADRDVVLNTLTTHAGVTIAGLPPEGLPLLTDWSSRGLLFDGRTGALRWDRPAGRFSEHRVWADLNRDGKADVLTATEVKGERDGIRILAVDGAGRELYRRDVTMTPPPGEDLRYVDAHLFAAGDLDDDGIEDAAFYVVSDTVAIQHELAGLFLVRTNRARVVDAMPFGGTLDGGSDERVHVRSRGVLDASFTVGDGWNGGAYWTVDATAHLTAPLASAWWGLAPLPGARGRCDGAILQGGAPGAAWFDVLDGGTGRVRWSRTYRGVRPRTTVVSSGRAARC